MVIGNAWKTIASRLSKVEAPDLETPDVEEFSKIEKVYNKIGITIKKSATEMRDLQDVLDELSGKWNTLSDVQKQEIALESAGVTYSSLYTAMCIEKLF